MTAPAQNALLPNCVKCNVQIRNPLCGKCAERAIPNEVSDEDEVSDFVIETEFDEKVFKDLIRNEGE